MNGEWWEHTWRVDSMDTGHSSEATAEETGDARRDFAGRTDRGRNE